MELDGVRAEFLSPEERDLDGEAEETKHMYSIKFVRNMKYTAIYTEDREVFEAWRKALGKLAIMTDFHECYQVLSHLGKGSFAIVSLPLILLFLDQKTKNGIFSNHQEKIIVSFYFEYYLYPYNLN